MEIVADGTGSTVDLTGLNSVMGFGSGTSSLQAKNGGAVLVRDQGLLLANTTVDVPPGHPVLPDYLAATNLLTVCAKPWHSYWVEARDATQAGSPWTFVMRVPLTNNTQLVNLEPTANTELRIWEFVSDTPILDVLVSPDAQVQLVLYSATNQTYELRTTSNFNEGFTWQSGGIAAMTNAFHIFPSAPMVDPARFYRLKQIQ